MMVWDKEACRQEVLQYTDNTLVNFSELARKHGLDKSNGGQIVKYFLEGENIDLDRFEKFKQSNSEEKLRHRRKKIRYNNQLHHLKGNKFSRE